VPRFKISYNWYRFMGISTLFLTGYIVIIGIFGKTDISPLLPTELASSIQAHWPDMPFFTARKEFLHNGKEEKIFLTVPTRQLTPQEIAALEAVRPPVKTPPNKSSTSAPVAR